jgi:DNA-binding beta-propeller fold protein YncE/mono/diheme cytochrome c family protein
MNKKLGVWIALILLLVLVPAVVIAAPPGQGEGKGEAYTVVADDWLSKLADKYYGEMMWYPAIVSATNAKAAEDSSYHKIDNPDLIEVGWKIWIPSKEEAAKLMKQAAAPAAKEVMVQGRPIAQFFADTCGGCHGVHREGALGPALIPGRLKQPDQFYFDTIKNGRTGTSMLPLGGQPALTDEEIWELVKYIKSEPEAAATKWGMEEIQKTVEIMVPEDKLADKPTHSGNLDNLMLVTEREARGIAVFDGDTHTFLGKIKASYRAHGYTFDPTNPRWAYNVGRDGWLFKIDLYTLKAVAKVRVGIDSRAIAISDDGKYVIVGNYIPTNMVIVDTKTMQPVKVIEAEGTDPDGKFVKSRVAGINASSRKLGGPYFLVNLKEAGQVWRIDYSKPDFPVVKLENVGKILHEGFETPDQKYFYVTSQASNWMAVVDIANWKLVTKIPTGQKPHPGPGAIWKASDGKQYAATVHIKDGLILIWDVATNKEVKRIPTVGPGLFIRTNDNTPYVWADALFSKEAPYTIYAVEKDPPFEVHVLEVEGCKKCLHPEPTADGKYVYISDWAGNKVYVYDATTFKEVKVFEDITTPTGIFNSGRRYETLGH